MKSLVEAIKESCNKENKKRKLIKESIHGVKPADEKLFWKWVKDLGESDIITVINKDEEDFYKKVADLGTTSKQFETFSDVFFTISNQFLDFLYDDDSVEMSDDGCEYASWNVPFYGETKVTGALKKKSTGLCDEYTGESVGYAMSSIEDYEEYLEDNELEPKGYK